MLRYGRKRALRRPRAIGLLISDHPPKRHEMKAHKEKVLSLPGAKGQGKIVSMEELARIVRAIRQLGHSVVQAHGTFDLVHLGHVKHLEAARRQGDVLVVTVTGDAYVNKGPNRPVFGEQLRAE